MMVLSMKQIRLLMLFFHSQAKSQFKGIKNLLDKIEYYNENDHILEEDALKELPDCVPTKYYLLLKPPALKDPKVDPPLDKATMEELQDRSHIRQLLVESDLMPQYKPMVRDPNSVS